ncbi:6303_t:CDS:1 [Scutellospora calospora]|uniref:6303_t:CDS:1 n=1 Tax=Scutellospora calospora TaxID=85575 RepID=A0ACA9MUY3_9GLOM|nr:6303_t:CDS:1 [Scutellospora calospora]
MTTRKVLGELHIQNVSEQEQTNKQKNKRNISEKETDRKVKKTKNCDVHELELGQKEFDDTSCNLGDILDEVEYINILETIPNKHNTEIKALSELYKNQFPQWYVELTSGFNILLYGYGSKKELLEEFSETYLRDNPLIVINGFYPELDIWETFMQIIDGININVNVKSGSRASLEKLTTLIQEYFLNLDRDFQLLYIVIHNIDGQNLRTLQIQNCLSILASCPNIYLIASVDDVNATLLFDQDRTAKFNWVWHDTSTFKSYETDK